MQYNIKRSYNFLDDFYTPWFNIDSPDTGNGDNERRTSLTTVSNGVSMGIK